MTVSTIDPAGLNIGQIGGRRNLIINGSMQVAQRGTSISYNNESKYSALDRWLGSISDTGSVSQQSFTVGQTDVPTEPKNYMRIATTSGSYTKSIFQRIEDVRNGAGQTLTISFYAKNNSGTPTLELIASQKFGSGGSSDVDTTIQSSIALTSSWTKYSYSFTLPSISGKTIGINDNLQFRFNISAGISETDFAQVQLEVGDVATPFEHRSYGEELSACQRYYQRGFHYGSAFGLNNANNATWFGHGKCHVTMRTTPTVSIISGVSPTVDMMLAGIKNYSSGTPVGKTVNSWKWDMAFSGGTLGNYYIGVLSNDCVECSAEL